MLLSLGMLFLVGLSLAGICQKLRLPRIIGMVVSGVVLGPYVLDVLSPSILGISAELREIALIIILIKAGLTLNIQDLKQVGRPAVLMAFLPACFEIAAYFVFAPMVLGVSYTDALVMGAVLAAVSPAIVVPRMVHLIEEKYGTKKSIPQLILAGASCDDVFVIVLFTTFLAMAQGEVSGVSFINVPVSIGLGIIVGGIIGLVLHMIFEYFYSIKRHIRNTTKLVVMLGVAFIVISMEDIVSVPFSGLLAVVMMACVYKLKGVSIVTSTLSRKVGKLWVAAEVILFVLLGASVDIQYLLVAGLPAVLMIFIGLSVRCVGVVISLLKTKLNVKERMFCVFAYLPKATVQAAIGAVPLSFGIAAGEIILTTAVLSIVITAPLGALAIDSTYSTFLKKN